MATAEEQRERKRIWRKENAEKIRAYRLKRANEDREANRLRMREWSAANPGVQSAKCKAWRAANPEKVRENNRRAAVKQREKRHQAGRKRRPRMSEEEAKTRSVQYYQRNRGKRISRSLALYRTKRWGSLDVAAYSKAIWELERMARNQTKETR